jgi:hypothetical protein
MKKIKFIVSSFLLLWINLIYAQVPEYFSYQAVVRDATGKLQENKPVGIRISILQGSENGTSVYRETHAAATNANGLVSLQIGNGDVDQGTFASIDWTGGLYFVKTEIDPQGGDNFSITSVSQLLSVPFALYAKTAGNSNAGSTNLPEGKNPGDILYWNRNAWSVLPAGLDGQVLTTVAGQLLWRDGFLLSGDGDAYEVGDIYYDNGDPQGVVVEVSALGQYAKIIALVEYYAEWSDFSSETGAQNQNSGDLNLNIIRNIVDESVYPAFEQCINLGSGWYLPALNEMLNIEKNKTKINDKLANISGATPLDSAYYWTSTEVNTSFAQATVLRDSTFTMTNEMLNRIELDFSHIFDENGDIIPGMDPTGKDTTLLAGEYLSIRKNEALAVRPMRRLSWTEAKSKPKTTTPYQVGDIYPSAQEPEGIVFEIWNGGLNGKIVSLTEDSLVWSIEDFSNNATAFGDGSINQATVKAREVSMDTYPAFKFCANKGLKWYLPAENELNTIYSQIPVINTSLETISKAKKIKTASGTEDIFYWSSTEVDASKAKMLNFKNSLSSDMQKSIKALVRSVRTF